MHPWHRNFFPTTMALYIFHAFILSLTLQAPLVSELQFDQKNLLDMESRFAYLTRVS